MHHQKLVICAHDYLQNLRSVLVCAYLFGIKRLKFTNLSGLKLFRDWHKFSLIFRCTHEELIFLRENQSKLFLLRCPVLHTVNCARILAINNMEVFMIGITIFWFVNDRGAAVLLKINRLDEDSLIYFHTIFIPYLV